MNETREDTSSALESRVAKIESELLAIFERNKQVEAEKRWETSAVRRISILILTYILMAAILTVIGTASPLINAIIPTLGYFLSTLYLTSIKGTWINRRGL